MKIKTSSVRQVSMDFARMTGSNGHAQVTEWENGEGVDIHVDADHTYTVSMTCAEFDAVRLLYDYMNVSFGGDS
jgi:hypothetical protein